MDLSKILSISGKSGLFKVVSQMKNAVLVESLVDKKRFPAFSHEKISSLEEIAVFTTGEDKPLKDVLKAIYEKAEGKMAPDSKEEPQTLTKYFLEVLPDYDQEKVYQSDIKRILSWYNLLLENELLDFTEETEEGKETEKQDSKPEAVAEEPAAEEKKAAKPKKTTTRKTKKEE